MVNLYYRETVHERSLDTEICKKRQLMDNGFPLKKNTSLRLRLSMGDRA